MGIIKVESLVDAGVHFGHRCSRWNPKMQRYIYGKRNLIHIIDLRETIRGLIRAYNFLFKLTARGGEVLFVGTKRQARSLIRNAAAQSDQHYVAERWLGGMLTNFETVRSRLARLEELEELERDGSIEMYSKMMISRLRREKRKIKRNLEGVRNMNRIPDALVIIDPKREGIALKEAIKLHIPTVCLIDTDSDPDPVDICIPGNDDAFRSIQVILDVMADAVRRGRRRHSMQVESQRKATEVAKAPTPAPAPAAAAPPAAPAEAAAESSEG